MVLAAVRKVNLMRGPHDDGGTPPVPGYELLKLLGRNGHLIYLARQTSTGRLIHLRVVHSSGDFGRMIAEDLRQQAQVLAGLDHPNIARLVEVAEGQGYGFFSAIEYVEGDSVDELVKRRIILKHAELVRVIRAVAAALDHAHGRNVVHGSIHPKHILVGRAGRVMLTGFGKVGQPSPGGRSLGNPHFLAPELFASHDQAVPQTDVYGLAEVAFLVLSGSFPFQGVEGIGDLIRRKHAGPPPSVRERRPELPQGVDLTLQRAMAVRPDERFRSAGKFAQELDRALCDRAGEGKKWWQLWR